MFAMGPVCSLLWGFCAKIFAIYFSIWLSHRPSVHPSINSSSHPLGSGQGEMQQRRLGQEDNKIAVDRSRGRDVKEG